jgi:hypothetical protein
MVVTKIFTKFASDEGLWLVNRTTGLSTGVALESRFWCRFGRGMDEIGGAAKAVTVPGSDGSVAKQELFRGILFALHHAQYWCRNAIIS